VFSPLALGPAVHGEAARATRPDPVHVPRSQGPDPLGQPSGGELTPLTSLTLSAEGSPQIHVGAAAMIEGSKLGQRSVERPSGQGHSRPAQKLSTDEDRGERWGAAPRSVLVWKRRDQSSALFRKGRPTTTLATPKPRSRGARPSGDRRCREHGAAQTPAMRQNVSSICIR
jgi:hypothetical protein